MSTRYQDRKEESNPPIKRSAYVQASASGNTIVVAAVAGKIIKVYGAHVHAAADVSVAFRSHTATVISGLAAVGANGGYVLTASNDYWFKTAAGEALYINLSGAVSVSVLVIYTIS